ncbi:MAG: dihydrolipoamide acetyltransferase family protein [Bacteroidales bacterium]|jgi:2-oxoglutarate dehydrogenase E2 component (dihydrolipoamide succinyltransferase)
MATFDIIMPKMGESVQEATITKWFKKPGDAVEEEDVLLEIATDKVDSEIPSPVDGVIAKILFEENAVVAVGEVIAVINLDGDAPEAEEEKEKTGEDKKKETDTKTQEPEPEKKAEITSEELSGSDKFLSPLVKNIIKKEGISVEEINKMEGTGRNGRIRKQDVLGYLKTRTSQPSSEASAAGSVQKPRVQVTVSEGDEIVQMDRLRKLIADNMVLSKQISPHVTNFIETDVTNLVVWRNKVRDEFEKREKQKLTYMPVFIEAVAKALKEFPGVNASVDDDKIILRKNVNIGIAVALPSGNLIVPVIKNADQKSLVGLTVDLNTLAQNARNNKLNPDDIQGGTFTISNFGTFRNLSGTPIINQPQVAILATGTIEKKPAVLETPTGDVIAIRHKMMLALTYDHRVVDGALAGAFLKYLSDYLENIEADRSV